MCVAVIAAADVLLFRHEPGSSLGMVFAIWWAGVLLARPGLLRDPRARLAVVAAGGFSLVMIDRPGLLALFLFGLFLTVAVLSARVRIGEPAWRWIQRLVVHGVMSVVGPLLDGLALARRRRGVVGGRPLVKWLALLLPPAVGGAVFMSLFASANPLISDALAQLRAPPLSMETVGRVMFWGVVGMAVFATLRPRWRTRLLALPSWRTAGLPGVTGASIVLSLIVFNAIFALQNGLDLAFLWSGAPLPGDVTLAEYAHRGAYPLIVTALLAGLFVLVALRPGSETARRPLVRRLVTVWVAQNLLLVASSILRTADYVEAFGLTRFRLAAMIWMLMVAVGLGLICWRMLKDRDGHWLIDANVRLVLVVFAVLSVIDLGSVTAAWNVRHAREVDGSGAALDLAYLRSLDTSALVSLVELEISTSDPVLRDRVAAVREDVMRPVLARADWRDGWVWRDARRLARVETLTAGRSLSVPAVPRGLDGRRLAPLPSAPMPSAIPTPAGAPPLTSGPGV